MKIKAHKCISKPTDPSDNIRKAPLRPTYGIPTSKVARFISREDIVKDIVQELLETSTCRMVLVLQGMGGSGKIEVALEICDRPEIR